MESVVEEEGILPSPLKKQKADDEESDGGNSSDSGGSSSSSDEDMSNLAPEWDVDSYDGREYISDPELRQYCDDEDAYQRVRIRRMEWLESRGFLDDPDNHVYRLYTLPFYGKRFAATISSIISLCIERFNKEKGKTVKCVSVERVNLRHKERESQLQFYITFMARESPDGPLVEYQAKGFKFAEEDEEIYPIFCRPSHRPIGARADRHLIQFEIRNLDFGD